MSKKYKQAKETILTDTKKEDKVWLVRDSATGEFIKTKHFAGDTEKLDLELCENTQFIYELDLAEMELESFSLDAKIGGGLRTFTASLNSKPLINIIPSLKSRLAYFQKVNGEYSDYYFIQKYNQTRSVNQYLTHWFYPYKGKYHPQMIRALLNIIGVKPCDTILDPFIGSGTTALECQLMNINCIGIDVSPLCVTLSKVKTQSLEVLQEVKKSRNTVSTQNSKSNMGLFPSKTPDEIENEKVRNFYVIAEMIAQSDHSRRGNNFEASFRMNIDKMIKSLEDYKSAKEKLGLELGKTYIREGDARKLDLGNQSVDGIVCSPPYSIALNYVQNDAHALNALGYNLTHIKEDFIGVRGAGFKKFELYNRDMEKSINEMYRVLKPGKYCVIVIGNVTYQNQEVDTTGITIKYCEEAGFKLTHKIDKIIFGLYNVMQKEHILIFQKPGLS